MQTYSVRPASPIKGPTGTSAVLEERRMTSLDGWRGIAILSVFFYHYALTSQASHGLVRAIGWFASGCWAGVDLFFVLSGFLITGILLDTKGHLNYFRNFYARRTIRIFPLYYGVLLLILLLVPFLHISLQPGHASYLFYLGNIAAALNPTLLNIPPFGLDTLWSLAVEEQFYLVWPFLVAFIANRRQLIQLTLAGMVFGLGMRVFLFWRFGEGPGIEWSYHALPMRCDGLLCGALAAILIRTGSLERASSIFTWPAFIAGLVYLAVCAYDGSPTFHTPAASLFMHTCLAVLFAKLLLVTIKPQTWAFKVGSLSILRFFGKYSYGIYIFHRLVGLQPVLRFLQASTHSVALGGILFCIVALIASTLAAVLSYELFERHFLKLKRHFSYSAKLA